MKLCVFLVCLPFVLAVTKVCPGGRDKCPDNATCCSLSTEGYGCCPITDAVCCNDHIHCCPSGYKCASGMCVTAENNITSSKILSSQHDDIICPDKVSTCPEDTTCCKTPNTYACCPMEDAVCCSDGYHCCPNGTTCNVEEGKCEGDRYVTQMYASYKNLLQSKLSKLVTVFGSVYCPDESQCPDKSTCCKLPNGIWGCCPFVDATCCADGLHCCPEYMTCDAASHFCTQGSKNVTAKLHMPAKKKIGKTENIICPDTTTCGNFETCCRISETAYGCCQYANATCCADRQHCCPFNQDCDVASGKCVPRKSLMFDLSNEI